MLFPSYQETGWIYHIVSLTDLKKVLENGIRYDDKSTYKTKYDGFHQWIDRYRTGNVPDWVIRSQAIFASINYPKEHQFHSHTAILAIKINPKRCWVANENCVNQIYEPFVLQNISQFAVCRRYLEKEGKELIEKYWSTSLSFEKNLEHPQEQKGKYDTEVLVLHDIAPKDIFPQYIVSDHRMMDVQSWKKTFCEQ